MRTPSPNHWTIRVFPYPCFQSALNLIHLPGGRAPFSAPSMPSCHPPFSPPPWRAQHQALAGPFSGSCWHPGCQLHPHHTYQPSWHTQCPHMKSPWKLQRDDCSSFCWNEIVVGWVGRGGAGDAGRRHSGHPEQGALLCYLGPRGSQLTLSLPTPPGEGPWHTSSQEHTSQMMPTSILRPLEKDGFRWMVPFWSASGSWHA